ncbi:MAG TPA: DUF6766 family protein [Candidatus Saccharimonadales bacterium]|nr:DUF6766 family protein [Candidatus Saccharimonadales bacterium]
MTRVSKTKLFVRDNGLSLFMFGLFFVFLIGLSIAGHYHENNQLVAHGQVVQTYMSYITSGSFIEAVFENWESEFLQMAALVLATIFLRQKGAADSKKIRGTNAVDASSRHTIIKNAFGKIVYANSLSLALIALFLISFTLHAVGGVAMYNSDAAMHGERAATVWQYVGSSQFWFESFQNWQSEFLAVGTLLVLSVYLRQQGSPQSKPLGDPDQKTG